MINSVEWSFVEINDAGIKKLTVAGPSTLANYILYHKATVKMYYNVIGFENKSRHVFIVHHTLYSNKLGDKLDGYQKKKYVCKLIFIFLLGNNIEFGHQEAVNLLASLKFSEKQIVSEICLNLIVS